MLWHQKRKWTVPTLLSCSQSSQHKSQLPLYTPPPTPPPPHEYIQPVRCGNTRIFSCFDFSCLRSFLFSTAQLLCVCLNRLNVGCYIWQVLPWRQTQVGLLLIFFMSWCTCIKRVKEKEEKGEWPDVFIAAHWSRSSWLGVNQFLWGCFSNL